MDDLKKNSLPPHELNLKIGLQVMLIRNINVNSGVCNGTRLIILNIEFELL